MDEVLLQVDDSFLAAAPSFHILQNVNFDSSTISIPLNRSDHFNGPLLLLLTLSIGDALEAAAERAVAQVAHHAILGYALLLALAGVEDLAFAELEMIGVLRPVDVPTTV